MSLFTERLRSHGMAGSLTDEAADKIDEMEKHLEMLEAALREILSGHPDAYDLARIALDQSSPPEASD